jgi:hypothetical protein
MGKEGTVGNEFGRVLLVLAFLLFTFAGPGLRLFTGCGKAFVNWALSSMTPKSVE